MYLGSLAQFYQQLQYVRFMYLLLCKVIRTFLCAVMNSHNLNISLCKCTYDLACEKVKEL